MNPLITGLVISFVAVYGVGIETTAAIGNVLLWLLAAPFIGVVALLYLMATSPGLDLALAIVAIVVFVGWKWPNHVGAALDRFGAALLCLVTLCLIGGLLFLAAVILVLAVLHPLQGVVMAAVVAPVVGFCLLPWSKYSPDWTREPDPAQHRLADLEG